MNDHKRKVKRRILLLVSLVLLVLALSYTNIRDAVSDARNTKKNQEDYAALLKARDALLVDGDEEAYEAAKQERPEMTLSRYSNEWRTLSTYQSALEQEASGNLARAYMQINYAVDYAGWTTGFLTEEQNQLIVEAQSRIRKEKADEEKAEREYALAHPTPEPTVTPVPTPAPTWPCKPIVGMDVSNINRTVLGKAVKEDKQYTVKYNGENVKADRYRYNDGDYWVFAYVYKGKVIQVDYHLRPTWDGTGTYPGSTGNNHHVNEYSDPDEFYYWNEDDFVDYEEAEEYYYSHTK